MTITSKVELCNLSLSILGNSGEVIDIDSPTTSTERTFAIWYDSTRQSLIKSLMPNFALERRIVASSVTSPAFGYANVFEYPVDCLKVLGLGNVDEKQDYVYYVEGNRIYTEDAWSDGLELRFVKDVTDVGSFSPEFVITFARTLAANVCMGVTQDLNKHRIVSSDASNSALVASGLNAQENRPIRVSHSRFRQSRYGNQPINPSRK